MFNSRKRLLSEVQSTVQSAVQDLSERVKEKSAVMERALTDLRSTLGDFQTSVVVESSAVTRFSVELQTALNEWRRHINKQDPAVPQLDPSRRVGVEASKTYKQKIENGFIDRYLSGPCIQDIGYRGYLNDILPIVPQAIGIELDYPGYDGRTLPFPDDSQDAVYSSHCLEHITDYQQSIQEWFRVLKPGGHLVIAVPHHYLYEKRTAPPSRWNADHKRFYTPATLMREIEESLRPNTYRVRQLIDNDEWFDYTIPPDRHSGGNYEIELVLQKIVPPTWALDEPEIT